LTLRTPYVENPCSFAPTEAMQKQRYIPPLVEGSRGLLYYFPEDRIPAGRFGDPIQTPYVVGQYRADGMASAYEWRKTSTWFGANTLKHSSSKLGYAVRCQNDTLGHADAAPCLQFGPLPDWIYDDRVPLQHAAVFAIVQAHPGSGTSDRVILTHTIDGGTNHVLELSANLGTREIFVSSGRPPIETGQRTYIGNYWPDDNWLMIALNMEWRGVPFGMGGVHDLWVNRQKMRSEGISWLNAPAAVDGAIVGANFERTDGKSWKGTIAQVAYLVSGKVPIQDSDIVAWFDDPWEFFRAERVSRPTRACIEGGITSRPALAFDVRSRGAVEADVGGELAVSGGVTAESSVAGGLSSAPAAAASITSCKGD
jgi:hypothetical protein